MLLFVGQHPMKLLIEFPPRDRSEPVLSGPSMGPGIADMAKLEVETAGMEELEIR